MVKKIISGILALTMLFMTACGQADSSDDIKETSSVTTVEQTQTEDTSSDSEPVGTEETTTTTTASETSEKEEKTSSQTDRTEETATTTTKTSEGNADTTTTTTPAITTTDASITRIATEITVPQTTTAKATTTTRTTTKATTKATTQATQKPVVTTTTKATTKPVTTTKAAPKPSSDKIIYEVKYKTKYDDYTYVTETQSRNAICEKGIASMAAEINKIRKANGLNTLKVDTRLTRSAMIRARELAETYVKYGGISHTRPNGEHADSVADIVDYDYSLNENAYYAFEWIDWKECLNAWLKSPDHKKNILNKDHRIMGLAIINVTVRNEYMRTGSQITFAIQHFGNK